MSDRRRVAGSPSRLYVSTRIAVRPRSPKTIPLRAAAAAMIATGSACVTSSLVVVVVFGLTRSTVTSAGVGVPSSASAVHCQTATIFGLKTVDCQGLGLDEVPRGLDRDVKVLKFAENRLPGLVADHFRSFPTVQEIYLVRNRISTIEPGALRGLLNLQKLDLEANQLTTVKYDFLADARSVRVLNFRYNPIVEIEPGALSNLVNLEEINLEHCRLAAIDARTFEGLDRLVDINIADNDLVGLPPEMERHLPVGLRVFRFYRNPWQCDCRLRWLRVWTASRTGELGLLGGSGSGVNWDFARNTPTCAGPRLLRGVSWKLLDADQFACPAQIIVNSSTTLRVTEGSNASLECLVSGDPIPAVTWYRDAVEIDRKLIEARRDQQSGSIRVFFRLVDVTFRHAGDYRCVAQNSAGRSEVTFKVWMDYGGGPVDHHDDGDHGNPFPPDVESGPSVFDGTNIGHDAGAGGMRVEIVAGAAVGAAVIVLVGLIVAAIICVVKRRQHFRRHHSYHVRDYHPQSNNNKSAGSRKHVRVSDGGGSPSGVSSRDSKNHSLASPSTKSSRGFSRCGSEENDVTAAGRRRRGRTESRLLCFRSSPEVGAAGNIEYEDEEGEDDIVEVDADRSTQVVVSKCSVDGDEIADKFLSTTLQSLLDDRRDSATTDHRHPDNDDRRNNVHENTDSRGRATSSGFAKIDDENDNRTSSGCVGESSSADGRRTVDELVVPLPPLSRADAKHSSAAATGNANVVAAPAPDLLQAGGGVADQLVSPDDEPAFGSRYACGRRTAATAKVSFAVDHDVNVHPLVVVSGPPRSASLTGLSVRCLPPPADPCRPPNGDGRRLNDLRQYAGPHRQGWPISSFGQRTPTSTSTAATVLLDTTPESATSGCSGYCVARTGSLGRRVRSGPASGRHVAMPPPAGRQPNCYNCAPSFAGNWPRPHAGHQMLAASKPAVNFKIALPSTIVGVTEGLFMPTSGTAPTTAVSHSFGGKIPVGPRKPLRSYEWRHVPDAGTAASDVSEGFGQGGSACQSEITSSSSSSTGTALVSFKPSLKRTPLPQHHQEQCSSAASSCSSSSDARKNTLGTAV